VKDEASIAMMTTKTEAVFQEQDKAIKKQTRKAIEHEKIQDSDAKEVMKEIGAAGDALRMAKGTQHSHVHCALGDACVKEKAALGDAKVNEWGPIDAAVKMMQATYKELSGDAADHTTMTELKQMWDDEAKILSEKKDSVALKKGALDRLKEIGTAPSGDLKHDTVLAQLQQFGEIGVDGEKVASGEKAAEVAVGKMIQKLN